MGFGEYKCEMCGGVFERGRSVKEALAEAEATFSNDQLEDKAEICDVCYRKLMLQLNQN